MEMLQKLELVAPSLSSLQECLGSMISVENMSDKYMYVCTSMQMYMYVHTYIHTYVHVYVHIYVRTCIHTCVYRRSFIKKNFFTKNNVHKQVPTSEFNNGTNFEIPEATLSAEAIAEANKIPAPKARKGGSCYVADLSPRAQPQG